MWVKLTLMAAQHTSTAASPMSQLEKSSTSRWAARKPPRNSAAYKYTYRVETCVIADNWGAPCYTTDGQRQRPRHRNFCSLHRTKHMLITRRCPEKDSHKALTLGVPTWLPAKLSRLIVLLDTSPADMTS